jgi:hypothetical protein
VPDSKWRPLLGLVLDEARTFLGDNSLSDEQTIELLEEQQLMVKPELYHHLNSVLRCLKIRVQVRESPTTPVRAHCSIGPRGLGF